ncbi:S1/P1 nuclease [Carboxylicivirga mesophila]|uniref:S1/P1 nuclease n=1 Tax=Carboxylicivirga mesophila TaxID=1166478 RepID=A0ABS5KAU4_9BACT|nr:S1/P1 nuclease [Carboxylicivirga mesophila]MBS2211992.1 S1/P1 nuclease [Carboxylicivirga mesophila]
MRTIYHHILLIVVSLLTAQQAGAWGSTGHRAIAEIAYGELSAEAKVRVKELLGNDYLPLYANWADEIRSEKDNPYSRLPHYVNMPLDKQYEEAVKNPQGDLVTVFNDMVQLLKDENATPEQQAIALKFIIHLVGDAHQPMHVGLPEDLGGNRVEVQWFGQKSNLHKLWDEDLIDYSRLSYTELAAFAGKPGSKQLQQWTSLPVTDWINETHEMTRVIYNNLGDKNYSFRYNHQFSPVVYEQIQKAGYRLALLLNKLLV